MGSAWRRTPAYQLGIVSIGTAERLGGLVEILRGHTTGRVGVSPAFTGLETRRSAPASRYLLGAFGRHILAGVTATEVPVITCPALGFNDGPRSPKYQPDGAGNGEAKRCAAEYVQRQVRSDVHPRQRHQHRRAHNYHAPSTS